MKSLLVFLMLFAVSSFGPAARLAYGQALKPFTEVTNVCPTCPDNSMDTVVLKSGETVAARVVAENPAFYCLERFGEQRALGRDQVQTIARRPNHREDDGLAFSDQILFKDGSVLCGKITVDSTEFKYFAIQVPGGNFTHYAFKSEIAAAFRDGKAIERLAKQ